MGNISENDQGQYVQLSSANGTIDIESITLFMVYYKKG